MGRAFERAFTERRGLLLDRVPDRGTGKSHRENRGEMGRASLQGGEACYWIGSRIGELERVIERRRNRWTGLLNRLARKGEDCYWIRSRIGEEKEMGRRTERASAEGWHWLRGLGGTWTDLVYPFKGPGDDGWDRDGRKRSYSGKGIWGGSAP